MFINAPFLSNIVKYNFILSSSNNKVFIDWRKAHLYWICIMLRHCNAIQIYTRNSLPQKIPPVWTVYQYPTFVNSLTCTAPLKRLPEMVTIEFDTLHPTPWHKIYHVDVSPTCPSCGSKRITLDSLFR